MTGHDAFSDPIQHSTGDNGYPYIHLCLMTKCGTQYVPEGLTPAAMEQQQQYTNLNVLQAIIAQEEGYLLIA